jgi:hypothetical protein
MGLLLVMVSLQLKSRDMAHVVHFCFSNYPEPKYTGSDLNTTKKTILIRSESRKGRLNVKFTSWSSKAPNTVL